MRKNMKDRPTYRIKDRSTGRYLGSVGVVTQAQYARTFDEPGAIKKLTELRVKLGMDYMLEKIGDEPTT